MQTDSEAVPSTALSVALGGNEITISSDDNVMVAELNAMGEAEIRYAWARAAYVAAKCRPQAGPGRPKTGINTGFYNYEQFAALGIKGLSSVKSVKRYFRAWEITGHPAPVLDQSVTFPTCEWDSVWVQVIEEMPTNPGYKPKSDPTPDYFGDGGRKQAEDIASFEQVVASRPTGYDVDMPKNKLMSDTIGPDANNTVWADAVAEYEADPSKGFMGNPYATPETILKAIEKEDAAYARNLVAIDFLGTSHWVTFERLLQRGLVSKQADRDAMTDEQIIAGFDAQDPNDVAKIKKISVEDEEKAIECLRFLYRAARLYFNQ